MRARQTEVEAAVDEAIRLTVWANVRRYVTLGGVAFVILDLVITLTVVVLLANATREADKNRATAACKNTAALAVITRANVKEQQKSTDSLVKSGNTLGLGKKKFAQLVEQGRQQNARYLASLDKLVRADCEHI